MPVSISGLGTITGLDQGLNVTGIVTATTFSGALTGDVTGNVTGTATTATNLADAANITTGTLSNDRLPATITKNLTGNVTGNLTGNVTGGITTSQITVGDAFIKAGAVGLGTTDTTGRDAGISTASGTLIYNSTTNQVEGFGPAGWVSVKKLKNSLGLVATGGIVNDFTESSVIYRTHVFSSSGTFEVTELSTDYPNTIEYLVVGGGGGGGNDVGGGGGAGGFRTNLSNHPLAAPSYTVSTGSYTVIIGAGGIGPTGSSHARGNNTDFYPTPASYPNVNFIRSAGGGSAAPPSTYADGGSGGGGHDNSPPTSGGAGNTPPDPNHPQPMGNPGGPGQGGYGTTKAGGGGGANSAGTPSGSGGQGGAGVQCLISYDPTTPISSIGDTGPDSKGGYFAGGGGGGGRSTTGASGGSGGGGNGGNNGGTAAIQGLQGTGGGGGGAAYPSPNRGANGGSGIVVVRYQIGETQTGTAKATGGNVSFYGGKTIHTFTGTGSFVAPSSFNETVEYVVLAGGGTGASGGAGGGGGGAGGYKTGTTPVQNATLTVTVGAGGAILNRVPVGYYGPPGGNNGANSSVNFPAGTVTSTGGGAGSAGNYTASPGGSGGGGSGGYSSSGGSGNSPEGYPGGSGDSHNPPESYGGGGGGGAGGAGQTGQVDATYNFAGSGGLGVQLPATFRDPKSLVGAPGPGSTSHWVGGGGSGGTFTNRSGPGHAKGGTGPVPATSTDGPFAGGGQGSRDPGIVGSPGLANTGGGGGGGFGHNAPSTNGGAGGSGIVIIAYPT